MINEVETVSESSVELRRHRRAYIEQILDRAVHLGESDRILIQQVYEFGLSMTDVARLRKEKLKSVQRSVSRLLVRMNSELYLFVLSHLDVLPESIRRAADLVVLQGYSLRRAADMSQQSLHHMREQMRSLHALAGV